MMPPREAKTLRGQLIYSEIVLDKMRVVKVTVYRSLKQYSASSLNCRYLNPYIKLKLAELAIQLYK